MITLTVVKERNKVVEIFTTQEAVSIRALPIVHEMKDARKEHRKPKISIEGVSYDTASERELLVSLGILNSDFQDALI